MRLDDGRERILYLLFYQPLDGISGMAGFDDFLARGSRVRVAFMSSSILEDAPNNPAWLLGRSGPRAWVNRHERNEAKSSLEVTVGATVRGSLFLTLTRTLHDPRKTDRDWPKAER